LKGLRSSSQHLPLSFEGEGDTGGEVESMTEEKALLDRHNALITRREIGIKSGLKEKP